MDSNSPADTPQIDNPGTIHRRTGRPLHFRTAEGIHRVAADEVVRLASAGSYTMVHLCCGRTIHVGKNIGRHGDVLAPLGFHRVHEGHLVNMAHIVTYAPAKGGKGSLLLSNGDNVPVSRLRRAAFLMAFSEGAVVV
jgi:DNA-binding LytR/AlgR family response regulator